MKTLITLGRFGDICNSLQMAYGLSRKEPVRFIASAQFASILRRTSYVEPVSFDEGQDHLCAAMAFARANGFENIMVAQSWAHPDSRRLTDSFQKEAWRLAGMLDQFGHWPLVFDKRDLVAEAALLAKHLPPRSTRPLVLVCTQGVSRPLKSRFKLLGALRGLDADVLDLDNVRAENPADLLALLDAADCLVTIDTLWLHLARASHCPTVALVPDIWQGAIPPPTTIARFNYDANFEAVTEAVQKQLSRSAQSLCVVANAFGDSPRHERAMATHPKDSLHLKCDGRPKLKELLSKALETQKDVIVFTNDDVAFPNGSLDKILAHAAKWDYGCSRRPAENGKAHCGREVFWFRRDWLRTHFAELPDVFLTVQKPDLILIRYLRKLRGIPTTMDNLMCDFPPIELPAGIVTHECHESSWANPRVENTPEAQWNERLWKELAQ